jgi:hypothetical protein
MRLASTRDRMGQVWGWPGRGTGWVRYEIGYYEGQVGTGMGLPRTMDRMGQV